MDISPFTYIAGIASVLGFILQVFNVFPKYGQLRKSLLLVILGFFAGSILGTFDSSSIVFKFEITRFTLLMGVFVLVIVGFLVSAAFTNDLYKRNQLFGVAGVGTIIFIFVLLFGSLATLETPMQEKSKLTISELISLAEDAEHKGNYDRAIMHLESVKSRLGTGDPRLPKIEEMIDETKSGQVK